MLTLSLIIPVYNEECHIQECLDAVAAQTRMPDEVIVVDNNCTDSTIELANQYPFVTVIKESNQGRGYARSAGFNIAHGDILGRIDADSRIDPNWVELVHGVFSADENLSGVSGLGRGWLIPAYNVLKSTFASRVYFWFAHAGFNTVTMWGANMAIRNSAWKRVRAKVILDDPMLHEDQDLSLWMAANGSKIMQINKMLITTNGQGYRYAPKLFMYFKMYEHTRQLHKKNGNFNSPDMLKLGFRESFPGRAFALLPIIYLVMISSILFPIDYVVNRFWPNSWWLD